MGVQKARGILVQREGTGCSKVKREIWGKITILGMSAAVSIQVTKCQGKFTIWV